MPCDPQPINDTTSNLTAAVNALENLPTLPIVAIRIGEVIHTKNAGVQQVAEILRTDPATSAKLLRLVNSPYFGIPGGVSDVARAIPFVGFNTLYQLVLSISVLETLGPKQKTGFDIRSLWIHSLTVGTAARELATELRFSDPGSCFTAGLLHDMGKIALAKLDGERFASSITSIQRDGLSIEAAEKLHGLVPHDRLGSRLARHWRFPATLATPIEQHHGIHRVDVRERLGPTLRTITEIVATADHLAHAMAFKAEEPPLCEADAAELNALCERNGLGEHQRSALISRTKLLLERSNVFLSLVD